MLHTKSWVKIWVEKYSGPKNICPLKNISKDIQKDLSQQKLLLKIMRNKLLLKN